MWKTSIRERVRGKISIEGWHEPTQSGRYGLLRAHSRACGVRILLQRSGRPVALLPLQWIAFRNLLTDLMFMSARLRVETAKKAKKQPTDADSFRIRRLNSHNVGLRECFEPQYLNFCNPNVWKNCGLPLQYSDIWNPHVMFFQQEIPATIPGVWIPSQKWIVPRLKNVYRFEKMLSAMNMKRRTTP